MTKDLVDSKGFFSKSNNTAEIYLKIDKTFGDDDMTDWIDG